jgi:hypothetical protein
LTIGEVEEEFIKICSRRALNNCNIEGNSGKNNGMGWP